MIEISGSVYNPSINAYICNPSVYGTTAAFIIPSNKCDGSINYLTEWNIIQDASINNIKATYIPNASLNQAKFNWNNGYLEPSTGVGDVTKAYVDGSLATRDEYLNDVYSKGQTDASFALKTDVNSSLGLYVKKAGDVMSGSLNMNNKRIQSLADPVDPSDATNRWYVDVSLVDRDLAQPWTLDNSTLSPSNADYDIQLSSIQMQTNGGAMTLVDMDVTNDVSGNINSYSFNMDGCTAFRIESIADSSSISQKYIVANVNYFYMGDPSVDNSWRWFIDPSTDLQFQKRISGTWTYAGKFSI
ncbi:MAG: hypothetical protein LLG13_12890 [Bacteroidales bacterium]|nr:hypothetical protein [Bacteroidales bacterium]